MRKIVIVGGGSAGWMSASYLSVVLRELSPPISITLVESPDIETIGVGEATVPPIRDFFSLVGITESELFSCADASVKNAIKFVNWHAGSGEHYFHPFEAPLPLTGLSAAHYWFALASKGSAPQSFASSVGVMPALCEGWRTPKIPGNGDYQAPLNYAYHIDAVLMARLLRDKAVANGVQRIEDTVNHVEVSETGQIVALQTRDSGRVEGELFIDCTGFRSLLIGKTLGSDWHSYSKELLCDRAVAMRTVAAQDASVKPYTTATARDAGWIWRIELPGRNGNGYVYSSSHITAEKAEAELRESLGSEGQDAEARHLQMRVGRRNDFWKSNCVAIGLSAGFIEPLESTGLHLINLGLRYLFDHLCAPDAAGIENARRGYNELMRSYFDETKDFIVMHYVLSKREDTPFWQAVRHDVQISPWLREKLDAWKYRLPNAAEFKSAAIFNEHSNLYILAGMQAIDPKRLWMEQRIPVLQAEDGMSRVDKARQQALASCIAHGTVIKELRRV